MLGLAVHVVRPARVVMDIAVPAQCFLGLSDVIAAGATIGVTTHRHARRLTARIHDRTTLDEIVRLVAEPPLSAASSPSGCAGREVWATWRSPRRDRRW